MKTKMICLGLLFAGLMFSDPCIGQTEADIKLAEKAYSKLSSAAVTNGITSTLGLASNIEMAIIGGFPLESNVELNGGVIVSHMCFSLGRWVFAVPPPLLVQKARKELQPWRESPEMAQSCKKLFAYTDAAHVLTIAAPFLSITGGIMMFVASTQYEYVTNEYSGYYYEKVKHPGLKIAGWVLIGAGLASSISGSLMIGLSKKELSRKIGTLKMSASPTSMGLIYKLP
jgi:hypothetical protein